jgi:hypothetical protein
MQGIYNYIPETNHVSRVYSAAAVLYWQFVLQVIFIIIIIIIIKNKCWGCLRACADKDDVQKREEVTEN